MRSIRGLWVLGMAAACSGGDDGDGPPTDTPEPTETADTASSPTTPTETGGSTGPTGDTGYDWPTIDCALVPPKPTGSRLVPNARAYHGLVFTDAGHIIGSDGASLVWADNYGGKGVFLPGVGNLEQLDRFPDGTIVIASSSQGAIFTISPLGAKQQIASVPNIYGVRVGPDGMVYAADTQRVIRVDPTTLDAEILLEGKNFAPKVLDFSRDHSKMIIGSIFENGKVWTVDLDTNLDPVGGPKVLASTPGNWHDGLTVDACDNVYVAEFSTSGMYRIAPDGTVSTLFQAPGGGSLYGHGVMFGNGAGGFLSDAIYIPQPYNDLTVTEVVIGVPHRSYPGPTVNGP